MYLHCPKINSIVEGTIQRIETTQILLNIEISDGEQTCLDFPGIHKFEEIPSKKVLSLKLKEKNKFKGRVLSFGEGNGLIIDFI